MALITKTKEVTMADIVAATREQIIHLKEDDSHGKGSTDEAGRPLQSA